MKSSALMFCAAYGLTLVIGARLALAGLRHFV